ncbi:MAG: ABC transporter permease [Firmicutes bacterium]|nr:ABC transporter permease [Bacillota bacterium]
MNLMIRRLPWLPPVLLLALLAVWEVGVGVSGMPAWFLPPPSRVLTTLVEVLPLLLDHSRNTVLAALTGLAAAVLLALVLAVVMGLSPRARQGLYPLLVVSQTVPIITVAPLLVIWFGFGILPKVVVVTLICFFPVAVSMVEGMRAADPDMVNLLRVMGSSRWQIIRLVRLPAAMPSFFAGLKIAATYAVMGAVIGEWLGAGSGLGVFMTRATQAYKADSVFAAIIVISLISLLLFALIELASRLAIPWFYNERSK